MTLPKDIEEIASESGNSFHCKVTNYFKERDWKTLVSPYYMDAATNKPRELDLIAEKHWVYQDKFDRKYGAVIIRLFIECKYIAQPTVFWFGGKDVAAATDWLVRTTPLRKDNMFTERHHYLASSQKVAKLFASKNKPATESEAIYRALNQSLNALVYLRGRESLVPEIQSGRIPSLATVEMPVILCNSFTDFYGIDMDSPTTPPQPVDETFQLEVNYAYLDPRGTRRAEYFLIDVVEFDRLDTYLGILESDKDAIFRIL